MNNFIQEESTYKTTRHRASLLITSTKQDALLLMSKEPEKLVIKLHLSMVESGRSSILNSKEFIFSFGIIFGYALLLFKAL